MCHRDEEKSAGLKTRHYTEPEEGWSCLVC
jgi:hypothetical protein